MLFNLRKIVSFSRFRPKRNPNKQPKQSEVDNTFYYPQVMNAQDFNFLDGISNISVIQQQSTNKQWLRQMKILYHENNYNVFEKLKEKQQQIIQKLDRVQEVKQLPIFFSLKINFFVKFRKWQQISVDCDNAIKFVKNPGHINQSQFQLLKLYNQKCISFIMNDHDKLYTFLSFKNIKNTQKPRRANIDKNVQKDLGVIFYTNASQRAELIKSNQNGFEIYFEAVALQSIGLFVLGQRQLGLKKLSKLTGNNFHMKMKQQIYILMVTALSFQNTPKQSLSEKYISKLSNLSQIVEDEAIQMDSQGLSPELAENIIKVMCKSVNRKSIELLTKNQLIKYGRILCLISQNYYLQGRIQDSSRVLNMLDKLSEVKQIRMIVIFIKMGIFYDSNQLQQTLDLFQEYRSSQMDENEQKASKQFYDINSINSDLVRINIYKLITNVYKQLKMNDKQEQIKAQCQAMQTTLLPYMLKIPLIHQQSKINQQNWRLNAQSVRIPYYYFDLKINKRFQPTWTALF